MQFYDQWETMLPKYIFQSLDVATRMSGNAYGADVNSCVHDEFKEMTVGKIALITI